MKTIKLLAASLAALLMLAACGGNKDPKVDVQLPSSDKVDSVSYLIGINFGYFIKANGFGKDLNYGQIKKGMMDFINSELDMRDENFNKQFRVSPDEMNRLFDEYISALREYNGAVNQVKGEAFLAEKFNESGVEKSESGLLYKIIEEGNEVRAEGKDTVWVNYTGTLIDGTEFDSNAESGEPVRMFIDRVVPGFGEGLKLVGEGGKIDLFIPAELGYGERGQGKIEPNSTLIFNVEITKIGKLYDVSAVSVPANDGTSISARSFCDGIIKEELEESQRKLAEDRTRKLIALKLRLLEV